MLWDEENRLMLINDNGMVSNYTYDHAGERAIKSYGGTQGVYINGAPAGSVDHSRNTYTIYVSPFMVVNKERFTKHYYAGSTRICSKIGNGEFNNQYRPGVFGLTAGSINYTARAYQTAQSKTAYYKQLGIPPGPPTMKGIYGEPENTGNAFPASNASSPTIPAGWPRYPKFNQPGDVPGPPIQWGDSITNATVEAGFGYIGTGAVEELDRFFYHPDHIGSSSVITNAQGIVTECMAYMPFGEILASQKNTNYAVPYLFTSKELDSETGLYYFGARYYDPNEGRWWGVDPLAEKFPNSSPFVYCNNNPVRFIDPTGLEGEDPTTPTGTYLIIYGAGWDNPYTKTSNQMDNFKKNAEQRKQQLLNSGIPESSIVITSAYTEEEFISAVNTTYDSGKITELDIYAHGASNAINFGGYETNKAEESKNYRWLFTSEVSKIDRNNFTSDSKVTLWGCNMGKVVKEKEPIAQKIADHLNTSNNNLVRAFDNYSEHKTKDGDGNNIIYDGTMIRSRDRKSQTINLTTFKPK